MKPTQKKLLDHHHRVVDYLRVSITDLCNLRCIYCRPAEGVELIPHDDILRYEEILTLIGIARDMGIRKIRITGGEPLVRRNVLGFISRLTAMRGIDDVGLTTNGVLLSSMASALAAAGLKRINVSLDTLRLDAFRAVTRGGDLADVLSGIEAALEAGFDPVKINVVLLRGVNEPDIVNFARLTIDRPLEVRFIERMPFAGEPVASAPDPFSARKALEIIINELGPLREMERRPLEGPATMFELDGALGRIGVIDPVSGHFCGTCIRLRLTARGTLRPCLLRSHEIDIKSALRGGATPAELAEVIRKAVLSKPMADPSHICGMTERMNVIGG